MAGDRPTQDWLDSLERVAARRAGLAVDNDVLVLIAALRRERARLAEAGAIVRELAESEPTVLDDDDLAPATVCGTCRARAPRPWGASRPVEHKPTCPYLRARAFTKAREGREDTDHG